VSSWDAARIRNEVEARRRMRRIGRILEILRVCWRYLIAERSHCSDIVWVVWCLWYLGACGVLEKETVWEMALQEEKGIEVDY
jgi:hypothetical protein